MGKLTLDRATTDDGVIQYNFSLISVGMQKTSALIMSSSEVFSIVDVQFPDADVGYEGDEIGVLVGEEVLQNLYKKEHSLTFLLGEIFLQEKYPAITVTIFSRRIFL